jgi:hypothetical protein
MAANDTSSRAHPPAHHNHAEIHFQSSDTVRDIVIGLADGLTVPFALAAGIAGTAAALANPTRLVVTAGLAEIAAGSIAMGLGGYLASRGDTDHYEAERRREEMEVVERPLDEEAEIYEIFEQYGVSREAATPVLRSLQANPPAYVDFMMRFELGLEEPARGRALRVLLRRRRLHPPGAVSVRPERQCRPEDLGRHHADRALCLRCAEGQGAWIPCHQKRCADRRHRRRRSRSRLRAG